MIACPETGLGHGILIFGLLFRRYNSGMNRILEQHHDRIVHLCRRYRVRTLEVFGSASEDSFDPVTSDIDLLVDFQPAPEMNAADRYFAMKNDLEQLPGRPVDLVMVGALENRYFIESVNQSRRQLYAA